MRDQAPPATSIVLYQTEDGRTRIECRFEDETVWLTQQQMAKLFQTSVPHISMHVRNLMADGELNAESVVKEFLVRPSRSNGRRSSREATIRILWTVRAHRALEFQLSRYP